MVFNAAGSCGGDWGCGFAGGRNQGPAQCILVILGQSRDQKGCGAARKRERHSPGGEDDPGTGAEHAFAQPAQAPAGPGGPGHGAAGDVHHLIGHQ